MLSIWTRPEFSCQVKVYWTPEAFLRFDRYFVLTLSQMTNFRPFETERVCRRRFFKFEEISRTFSKWLEITVGKGEIARY